MGNSWVENKPPNPHSFLHADALLFFYRLAHVAGQDFDHIALFYNGV